MSPIAVVVLAGVVSYALRAGVVLAAPRTGVPAAFTRGARFTVPVALAALAMSALTTPSGAGGPVALLVAVSIAVFAVRTTGSSLVALPVGLPVLWLLITLGW
jgi:branched-subunit amino acid transport protein